MSNRKCTLPQWIAEQIAAHASDECLLWPYAHSTKGYGIVRFNGRNASVHRIAFKLKHGRWPTPCGLHTCDTPACFNPRHIVEGTKADNNADMHQKGRDRFMQPGEDHWGAILTAPLVKQIRSEYIPWRRGHTLSALASKYNVSCNNIHAIVTGRSWRHLL